MLKPKYISVSVYQRSVNAPLELPSDMALYALLLHMVSYLTGLIPKELIYHIGEAHIYPEHIESCERQICRKPKPFPTLFIDNCGTLINSIDDFSVRNLIIQY